jgi:tetraacyldisaccharide 4'-kinase
MRRPWLAPLVPLYAAGVALRDRRLAAGKEPVRRLGWPVVSVGNLSTGGAGKTPLVIALARLLAGRGIQVDVLSRGYGRRVQSAARVTQQGTAEEFGDEPLLIAGEAGVPVYVASQRYEAGRMAEADAGPVQAGVHLLDDGFQHRQLGRDVDILLLNRADWWDALLPAGNLREPREAARRATVIAISADEAELEPELRGWGWGGPVWRVRRCMEVSSCSGPVAAFCGIARPEQFFAGLEAAGLRLVLRRAFADHHGYTGTDVERLVEAARKAGAAALVTTEKDRVRLGALVAGFQEPLPLKTARLRVEIEDEAAALEWLLGRLGDVSGRPAL